MMSTRRLQAAAAAGGAALVLLLTGCTDSSSTEDAGASASHDHGSMSQTADPAAAHNDADVSFASGMVPHHEQAIVMSDIILAKQGIDPRVVELANQIKAAQGPEIATMQKWLTEWGAPVMNHEGHDMSDMGMGMMSDQQLEQLRQAQGVDATRQFLTGMIAHHEGAVRMAQTELDTGKAEDAKKLARDIIDAQQREIATMKQILGSL
ncbi:uncharacterized protein (DUF305 family) [Mycobacterium sp. BK558]|uniref:DUF305 domain-containing protein n=1 Tax=Mycolicibacterium chlorophenolicum TaxID=37916 RepID=A0A0J6Y1Q4_9MYCO|nr:DUF305 domain-containing protein [Mycolicibacterium chlorophenolicum]KMO67166.1 hypothetical protein MCHLDSM_06415 [Mycolicibacterium chlorophenolicum]RZT26178.1 uncharacterized protein (DUF305 family) [Mycobacterium sp. BK558]